MAHYAVLDENNIVTQVLYVHNSTILDENGNESEELGIECCKVGLNDPNARLVRTSYNGNIRVRYAGIGYSYDEELDAFIPSKPYDSWVLNQEDLVWEPPVPRPTDAPEGSYYQWDEETISWVLKEVEIIQPPSIIISLEDFRSKLTLEEKMLWDNPETGTLSQKAAITTVKNEFPLTYDTDETMDLMDLLVEKEVFTTERMEEILSSFSV